MKISIVSGGTGSIPLQIGLKNYNREIKITNIINAYDNGKSTGLCRDIFHVLGSSDIRKNQYTHYVNSVNVIDKRIEDLFDRRYYNIGKKECLNIIKSCNFDVFGSIFKEAINEFFKIYGKDKLIEDVNISNIFYSYFFKTKGYEYTIGFFKEFFQIDDNIILNSTENLYLYGITENNILIPEEKIVEWNNINDKIIGIKLFSEKSSQRAKHAIISKDCEHALLSSNIIILSAGTQFSSLIPTYSTKGFKEAFTKSKAKKYLIMNNEEDLDAKGYSSNSLYYIISNYLDLSNTNIIINLDATENMRIMNNIKNVKCGYFGNDNGKHNPKKLASFILKDYYQIPNYMSYSKIFSDFDDTLYTRKTEDNILVNISKENMELFNSLSQPSIIVSGNSYTRIHHKISDIFGINLQESKFDLFCDGGLIQYKDGNIVYYLEEFMIKKSIADEIKNKIDKISDNKLNIEFRGLIENKYVSCISITSLEYKYRKLLRYLINEYIEKYTNWNCLKCNETGRGTLDIFNVNHDKSIIRKIINIENSIYLGDEIDNSFGNDYNIAKIFKYPIKINNIIDTNIILKIINEEQSY